MVEAKPRGYVTNMDDKAPLEGKELESGVQASGIDPDWLTIAQAAWDNTTDYLNTNYRKQFERNIHSFQSRHAPGSKYLTPEYATRSKLFRPRTRNAVRKNESAVAAALFSADDVVKLEAEDAFDPQKRRDASYWHKILNYRLDKTIPWFQIVVGAMQEAQVYGIVCSKQYWEYEEVQDGEELAMNPADGSMHMLDEETGEPIVLPVTKTIKDQPRVQLIEIENIRFDQNCDWLDPVNSSPFIIYAQPMRVGDVLEKMEAIDPETGEPEWYPATAGEIISYGKNVDIVDDTTKKTRLGNSETEVDHDVNEFETVFIRENIIRREGRDWVFSTIGGGFLLNEPLPIEEAYRHGIRPYVFGKVVIEAHKPIPAGTIEISQQLQSETNDVVNERRDEIKSRITSRKFVQRNQNTDLDALVNNTLGGVVLTDDVNSIIPEKTSNTTNESLAEQNRIDADFDEITGVFSGSSVATNRQLGETVGGMELMSQYSDKESEYLIRTFVETWVEPVLRQVVLLEQHYEDDERIKNLAIKNVEREEEKDVEAGETPAEGGMVAPEEPPEVPIEEPQAVDVRVNVGFGNLNPENRVQKVMQGINAMGSIFPWLIQQADAEEIAKEIFGAYGHKSGGTRFFKSFKPPEPQGNPEIEIEGRKLEIEEAKVQITAQMAQAELDIKENASVRDFEAKMAKIASDEGLKMEEIYAKVGIEREKLNVVQKIAGAGELTKISEIERKREELAFKERTGRDGI